MLLQTIQGNYEGFTDLDINKAREARTLHNKLGQFSGSELQHLLKEKEKVSHATLHNSPVMIDDFKRANIIFGLPIHSLTGATVQAKPARAEANYVNIPRDIIDMNKCVVLVAYVMFV